MKVLISIAVDGYAPGARPDAATIERACDAARRLAAEIEDGEVRVMDGARVVLRLAPSSDKALADMVRQAECPLLLSCLEVHPPLGEELRRFMELTNHRLERLSKLEDLLTMMGPNPQLGAAGLKPWLLAQADRQTLGKELCEFFSKLAGVVEE